MQKMTQHGQMRIQQRGYRNADMELVMQHGTDCTGRDGEYGFMLTNQDVHQTVERYKRQIRKLERLKGTYMVVSESNELITTYRPRKNKTTRLLRR
jgi:hypothetical protein